jgi:copper chaperone CopZ
MKRSIIMILVLFLAVTTTAQQAQDTTKKQGVQELRIKTSAVCDMCKETLEKAMAFERGVKSSNLDVESKMLSVQYDPKKTTPEKIRKAVSAAGYDADDVPADPRAYDNLDPCCKKDYKH